MSKGKSNSIGRETGKDTRLSGFIDLFELIMDTLETSDDVRVVHDATNQLIGALTYMHKAGDIEIEPCQEVGNYIYAQYRKNMKRITEAADAAPPHARRHIQRERSEQRGGGASDQIMALLRV